MLQKDYVYLITLATILVWTSPSIFLVGVLVWLMKDSMMIRGMIRLVDDKVQDYLREFKERQRREQIESAGICRGVWKNGTHCTYRAADNGFCRRHAVMNSNNDQ